MQHSLEVVKSQDGKDGNLRLDALGSQESMTVHQSKNAEEVKIPQEVQEGEESKNLIVDPSEETLHKSKETGNIDYGGDERQKVELDDDQKSVNLS